MRISDWSSDVCSSDLLQINGGRNDGFVAWGDSGALVMGHYGDNAANLRLWQIARDFTLCDNFFMGAFGGSYLNHQRSEEHTSELQSLMRISYAVFCLKKKKQQHLSDVLSIINT